MKRVLWTASSTSMLFVGIAYPDIEPTEKCREDILLCIPGQDSERDKMSWLPPQALETRLDRVGGPSGPDSTRPHPQAAWTLGPRHSRRWRQPLTAAMP